MESFCDLTSPREELRNIILKVSDTGLNQMYSRACLNKDGARCAEVLGSGDAVTFSLSSGFSATTPPMWVSLGKGLVFAHRHFWTSQCLGPSHCSLLSANVPLLVFFVVLLRKLFPVNPFFTKTLNKDQLWACFLDSPIWYFSEHDFCRHSLVLKDDWQ